MENKFILPKGGPYLLTHSVGPMTVRGRENLEALYLAPWGEDGGQAWMEWLDMIERFCSELGNLLGGSSDDFCPQPNLSSGLTKYLLALPCAVDAQPRI